MLFRFYRQPQIVTNSNRFVSTETLTMKRFHFATPVLLILLGGTVLFSQGLHTQKQSIGVLTGFGKTTQADFQTRFFSVTKPLGNFFLPEIGLKWTQQNYTSPRLQIETAKQAFFTSGLTFRKTLFTLHRHKRGSKYNAQAFELFATPECALPFHSNDYYKGAYWSVKTGVGLFHLQQKGRSTHTGFIVKAETYYRFCIPSSTTKGILPQASEFGLQFRVLYLKSHTFYRTK